MSRSVFTAEYQLQSGYIALSANKRTDVKYSLVSDRDSDLKPIFHFIIRHNKLVFLKIRRSIIVEFLL